MTDVLVCGAGVAGLSAACALGSLGLRVLVVDKAPGIRPVAKGEVFQPSALPALQEWGVLSRLDDHGALRLSRLVTRDELGGPLLAIDYRDLPEGSRHLLAQDYPGILRALTAGLPATVELRRATVVTELTGNGGRIDGAWLKEDGRPYRVRAGLVVAADGVSSALRKQVRIAGYRRAYPHRLATFEVAGTAADAFTAYRSPRGLRLVYPLPGHRVRVYAQVEPDELRGDARRWYRGLAADVPALDWLADAVPARPRRPQSLPVSRFLADRLIAPGLALAGDAAHVVHPMAAQGLGCAVADAQVLAALIAEQWDGAGDFAAAVDRALPAYQADRMPALVHNQRMSHRAARLITNTSPIVARISGRALRRTAADPRLVHLMAYNLAGLGIRPFSAADRLRQFGLLPRERQRPDHRAGSQAVSDSASSSGWSSGV
ncbi:FAD-dependent oxidoreductase [Amycolatopsis tolypomycina]|uniref:2-polyprenyl-6-methoxyphenol hydroxylase n=1 Tax=Amycolatopsis tolypomycina TaxID=208445 RepID=A0A1H4ZTM3_9PSEU|nr:NAD(P)/FAD-dependent oxidoreductase [Amycolatopsis tolypomycina]SED33337.1 2-polyprenyl-6-methoxyphenol hydroxylase [Amycolatopsis tolypomycina]